MHHHTGKEKAESVLVFQQRTHHRPYQRAAEAPHPASERAVGS